MHALFLGHTGIGKDVAVRNVANAYLNDEHGLAPGLDHIDSPNHLRVASVEAELQGTDAGIDVRGFLDIHNEFQARQIWREAFDAALRKLQADPSEAHQFLSLHATYYRAGIIYPRADLGVIRDEFRPDMIITLIDDVYDVSSVIKARDTKDALRLREIATWRAVELLVGDYIAGPADIRNFVVAVKHPISVVQRLIFGQEAKRVYCAFPISRTRAHADRRAEIDAFKTLLRATGATVFDPVTIDDLFADSCARQCIHSGHVDHGSGRRPVGVCTRAPPD